MYNPEKLKTYKFKFNEISVPLTPPGSGPVTAWMFLEVAITKAFFELQTWYFAWKYILTIKNKCNLFLKFYKFLQTWNFGWKIILTVWNFRLKILREAFKTKKECMVRNPPLLCRTVLKVTIFCFIGQLRQFSQNWVGL